MVHGSVSALRACRGRRQRARGSRSNLPSPWRYCREGMRPFFAARLRSPRGAAALAAIMAEIDRVPEAGRCPADVGLFWAYAAGVSDDAATQAGYDAAVAQLAAA